MKLRRIKCGDGGPREVETKYAQGSWAIPGSSEPPGAPCSTWPCRLHTCCQPWEHPQTPLRRFRFGPMETQIAGNYSIRGVLQAQLGPSDLETVFCSLTVYNPADAALSILRISSSAWDAQIWVR